MRCALAVLICLLAAAPAEAARWTGLGPSKTPIVAGGTRWVAQLRADGNAIVRDDATRRHWSVQIGGVGCEMGPISPAGVLLRGCTSSTADGGVATNYEAIDVARATRRAFTVTGPAEVVAAQAVGRHWIDVREYSYHVEKRYYRNLFTGEYRELDSKTLVADLDAVELGRKLCSPLRNVRHFEDPYTIGLPDWTQIAFDGKATIVSRRNDVKAWHCGQPRPRHLTNAPDGDVIFAGGWVSWIDASRVHAVRVRDGRRVSLTRPHQATRTVQLVQTRSAIYLSMRAGRAWRAYRAPLPH
jgi:hypothetical protein